MSGNNNNGRTEGATFVDGLSGQCAHFGGVDRSQIIRVPNSTSLQFNDAATFALWFKLDSYVGMDGWGRKADNGRMVFFAKDFDRGQINSGFTAIDDNNFRVDIGNNGFGCDATIEGNAMNDWHHIAMILQTDQLKIYVDGKEVASQTTNQNFNNSNSRDLIIGRLAQSWYPLHGCIDEFRVYNRALSKEEVAAIYSEFRTLETAEAVKETELIEEAGESEGTNP